MQDSAHLIHDKLYAEAKIYIKYKYRVVTIYNAVYHFPFIISIECDLNSAQESGIVIIICWNLKVLSSDN